MNYSELVASFLHSREARHASPNTLSWYRYALAGLGWFAEGDQLPTTEAIEEWLARSRTTETARNRLRAARACFRWAQQRHGITDPTAPLALPRTRREYPRVLTNEQLRALIDHAASRSPRDYAMVLTLIDTGIRLGELASLSREHISAGQLAVTGKTGHRIVPASGMVIVALANVGLPGTGPLWRQLRAPYAPMTVASIRDRISDVMRAVITGPKVGPHLLRHSFATSFLRAGGDLDHLRRILGHGTLAQTAVYLHLLNDDLQRAHARYSPLTTIRPMQATLEGQLWTNKHG